MVQFYIFAISSSESEYFNEKVMKVEIKGSIPSITTQIALRLDSQSVKAFLFIQVCEWENEWAAKRPQLGQPVHQLGELVGVAFDGEFFAGGCRGF